MSVEDRAFNAFFDSLDSQPMAHPEGDALAAQQSDAIDAEFADFDKFFERLSSLDDMNWSSEPQERDIVPLKSGALNEPVTHSALAEAKDVVAKGLAADAESTARPVRKRRSPRKPKTFFTTVLPKASERTAAAPGVDDAPEVLELTAEVPPAMQADVDALPEIKPPASASASLDDVTGEPAAPEKNTHGQESGRKEMVMAGTLGHHSTFKPSRKTTHAAAHSAPERQAFRFGIGPAVKLSMLGIMLFGLGMVGVWAALSLPAKLERAMPRLAALLHQDEQALEKMNPRIAAAPAPAQTELVMEAIELPPVTAEATAQPAQVAVRAASTQPEPQVPVRQLKPPAPASMASASTQRSLPAAPAVPQATRELPPTPTPIAATTRSVPVVPMAAASASPAPATPAPAAPAQTASVAAAAPAMAPAASVAATAPKPDGSFAVQVGACSSATCVENYRTLLAQHVPASDIQVIRADGSSAVQRVRVAPLSKGEAEEVKALLATADTRLQGAYVLTLH